MPSEATEAATARDAWATPFVATMIYLRRKRERERRVDRQTGKDRQTDRKTGVPAASYSQNDPVTSYSIRSTRDPVKSLKKAEQQRWVREHLHKPPNGFRR